MRSLSPDFLSFSVEDDFTIVAIIITFIIWHTINILARKDAATSFMLAHVLVFPFPRTMPLGTQACIAVRIVRRPTACALIVIGAIAVAESLRRRGRSRPPEPLESNLISSVFYFWERIFLY